MKHSDSPGNPAFGGAESSLQNAIRLDQPLRHRQFQSLQDPSLLPLGTSDAPRGQLLTLSCFHQDVADLDRRELAASSGDTIPNLAELGMVSPELSPECDRVQRDLGIAEAQLRDYHARLGKPFPHDAYLSELTALRDQLKAGLSGAAHEAGKEEGPSVSEVAERIKSLKAANTIEATPQRNRQKQSTAEEPITARIRRRTERMSASDPFTGSDVAPDAEDVRSQASMQTSSLDPPKTFQERIILERRRKDDGPSPP